MSDASTLIVGGSTDMGRASALQSASGGRRVALIGRDAEKLAETLPRGFDAFHPSGRIGRSEDAARRVCFLLSDASGWTTGAVHDVDGGVMAGRD